MALAVFVMVAVVLLALELLSFVFIVKATLRGRLQRCTDGIITHRRHWSHARRASFGDSDIIITAMCERERMLQLSDSTWLQVLTANLALAFFDIAIQGRVKVLFEPLHNEKAKTERIASGEIIMYVSTARHISNKKLDYTTSVVSLILRELCVVFLLLEASSGNDATSTHNS